MYWLNPYIEQIEGLIEEGSERSLTYAVLEARLAIERVCYERLKVAHDYISYADIRKWQPQHIVTMLIQEVDAHAAGSFTLSMSKGPVGSDGAHEYIEIGRQVGFDPARLGKLWHALGNFLHVRMPKTKSDNLTSYRDVETMRLKLAEALAELKPLEKGTLVSSGLGETVSFECDCRYTNKRRVALLKNGQVVSCINPGCKMRWDAVFEGSAINFRYRAMSAPCFACKTTLRVPEGPLLALKRGQFLRFKCDTCDEENEFQWKLMHRSGRA